jgi:transcriptional repressor NrdR
MKCPFCNFEDTIVRDSRQSEEGVVTRRRRECPTCQSRFTTFERIHRHELMVVKKNGQRRPFDRDKMTRSITMALRKRNVTPEQIELEISKIISKLESRGVKEVPSTFIGELIMETLSKLDLVAYVRFASVYRDFKGPKDFEKFLSALQKN